MSTPTATTALSPLSPPQTASTGRLAISAPDVQPLIQRVVVRFEFPVYFTRGLFRPENPVLRDALARREPDRQHRCLFVVDDGVAGGWPDLTRAIERYAEVHADAIEMVRPAWVLPGGEAAKNDPTLPERVLEAVHEYGVDRQSLSPASAAAHCWTQWATLPRSPAGACG
jgi:hypothetical protein